MAESNVNANRFDPYKNFKFRVELISARTTRDTVDLPIETLARLDMIVEEIRNPDKAAGGSECGISALFPGRRELVGRRPRK